MRLRKRKTKRMHRERRRRSRRLAWEMRCEVLKRVHETMHNWGVTFANRSLAAKMRKLGAIDVKVVDKERMARAFANVSSTRVVSAKKAFRDWFGFEMPQGTQMSFSDGKAHFYVPSAWRAIHGERGVTCND